MDCNFDTCRKLSDDQYTCDNCYIPKYCSETCKKSDMETHAKWCSPRTFVLKDFVPVKSKKFLDIGTYGEVQLMKNMSNHKFYAMKVIRKALVNDVIPLKVLFREIMIHKKLVHPNIVRLIDHFEDTTRIYIVLELVEKGSLFDLIRTKIKLSEKEACSILIQTCAGLAYLHEQEILHRDIKPENLLISKLDVIKICDFGWSASGSGKKVTFCGTLDYMSPEMINSESHTDKLDIWSLGILLYEMLHGTPPYRGKNPKEQFRLISTGSYTIGQHVSKSAGQLVRSILQLRPEARPTLVEILKSQWVQENAKSDLKVDWRVSSLEHGEGFIAALQGKVATLQFLNSQIQVIESELFRKFVIFDEAHKLISAPPEEKNYTKTEQTNQNVTVHNLYRNLGIDSGRATPISGRATPTGSGSAAHSRNNSRKGTFAEQNYTFRSPKPLKTYTETSPPLSRPPKSSRDLEETKKSQPALLRQRDLKDFREINLSPEPSSPSGLQSRPKSSFLSRFKGN